MNDATFEDKRREILEAAAGVIADKGLCETRIADVAKAVGVSPALIIYYFQTKEALLTASLTHQDRVFHQRLSERLDVEGSAADRLRSLIEYSCPERVLGDDDDVSWRLWFDLWSRSRHDPEMAVERQHMDERFRTVIANVAQLGIKTGEFVEIDTQRFALELSALIDGLAIQVLLHDPRVTPALMLETVVGFAERNLIRPSATH